MQLASSIMPSWALPAALVEELERLAADESAYNEKLTWRREEPAAAGTRWAVSCMTCWEKA